MCSNMWKHRFFAELYDSEDGVENLDVHKKRHCMCVHAAAAGKLDCLKYAVGRGCIFSREVYKSAVLNTNYECLVYIHEHYNGDYKIKEEEIIRRVINDRSIYEKELYDKNMTDGLDSKRIQIYTKKLYGYNKEDKFEECCKCLMFLHKEGLRLTNNSIKFAAYIDNVEFLEYVIKNKIKSKNVVIYTYEIIDTVVDKGSFKCIEYLYEKDRGSAQRMCEAAVLNGKVEILKCLHKRGYVMEGRLCDMAAMEGKLECLKYLMEIGCDWDVETCAEAANGNLECLKYLHENGCEWDERICAIAASADSLECLKYAHENGCEWDKNTCTNAASVDSLECLKYAHENGCDWDEKTIEGAIHDSNYDCFKYLVENGCPMRKDILEYTSKNGDIEMFAFLVMNGAVPMKNEEMGKLVYDCIHIYGEDRIAIDEVIANILNTLIECKSRTETGKKMNKIK